MNIGLGRGFVGHGGGGEHVPVSFKGLLITTPCLHAEGCAPTLVV